MQQRLQLQQVWWRQTLQRVRLLFYELELPEQVPEDLKREVNRVSSSTLIQASNLASFWSKL
jgi:hypothetical protein